MRTLNINKKFYIVISVLACFVFSALEQTNSIALMRALVTGNIAVGASADKDKDTKILLNGVEYMISEVIGTGFAGIVYLAQDEEGNEIAVKCLHKKFRNDSDFLEDLRNEQKISVLLQGEGGVAAFLGAGHNSQLGEYIAMEYLDSKKGWMSLDKFIDKQFTSIGVGDLDDLDRRLQVFENISRALSNVHAAGIHINDIHPENIFINKSDNSVKLVDFGYASTEKGKASGIRYTYASPEILKGNETDEKNDIYILGLLLSFDLLLERRVFRDELEIAIQKPIFFGLIQPRKEKPAPVIVGRMKAALQGKLGKVSNKTYIIEELGDILTECLYNDPSMRISAGKLSERISNLRIILSESFLIKGSVISRILGIRSDALDSAI